MGFHKNKISYEEQQKCRALDEFCKKDNICSCGDHTNNKNGICETCELLNNLQKENKNGRRN